MPTRRSSSSAILSKLSADAYVPLEFAFRVKEGQVVEIQPRITHGRGEPLPIEKKRFRGKITFVDPQIQPVAETAVRIRAEFENPRRTAAGLHGADDDLLEHRGRGGRRLTGPHRRRRRATSNLTTGAGGAAHEGRFAMTPGF